MPFVVTIIEVGGVVGFRSVGIVEPPMDPFSRSQKGPQGAVSDEWQR